MADRAGPLPLPPVARTADEVLLTFWSLIQLTNQQLKPAIEERQGLPMRLGIPLVHIRRGAVYPGLLRERLQLTPSAVTRVVEDLVRRGLVERALDPQDSRRIRLSLTAQGQDTLLAMRDAALDLWQVGLQGLSEAELLMFLGLLQRVQQNMQRQVQSD